MTAVFKTWTCCQAPMHWAIWGYSNNVRPRPSLPPRHRRYTHTLCFHRNSNHATTVSTPPPPTHTHTPRFSTPTLHVINLFKYGFLSFHLAIMPILVIHNIWAVGMHHWGARELEVGSGYVLELDKHNPKDKNAVQIMEGKVRRRAYVKRENATVISALLCMKLADKWLLKPKEPAIVRSHRTGPEQRCNVGCKISTSQIEKATTFLTQKHYFFEIK